MKKLPNYRDKPQYTKTQMRNDLSRLQAVMTRLAIMDEIDLKYVCSWLRDECPEQFMHVAEEKVMDDIFGIQKNETM